MAASALSTTQQILNAKTESAWPSIAASKKPNRARTTRAPTTLLDLTSRANLAGYATTRFAASDFPPFFQNLFFKLHDALQLN